MSFADFRKMVKEMEINDIKMKETHIVQKCNKAVAKLAMNENFEAVVELFLMADFRWRWDKFSWRDNSLDEWEVIEKEEETEKKKE